MSYPDFVAFLGQTNTPPGGSRTVGFWVKESGLDASGRVLDLACTTGFSSRLAARTAGCRACGIDISEAAIEKARAEARSAGLAERLEYSVADAVRLPFEDGAFTHVLAGCNFSFIQRRDDALDEAHRVLVPGGRLCVSNFYYASPPPVDVLRRVEEAVGFVPDAAWTRSFWESFLSRRFRRSAGEDRELPVLEASRLKAEIRRHVFEEAPALRGLPEPVKEACFERLAAVRLVLNEHRRYQRYTVEVWEKDGR